MTEELKPEELCDCPTWADFCPLQPKSSPMKRSRCWRCRLKVKVQLGESDREEIGGDEMAQLALPKYICFYCKNTNENCPHCLSSELIYVPEHGLLERKIELDEELRGEK